jgi:adenosylcobinamide-GDP ribazoletransferase
MGKAIRHYLLAVQFFSRVPVTGRLAQWVGFSPEMLRASTGHFPGVGCMVGLATALCTALLLAALPHSPLSPLVAAALGTVLSVVMTGAFHEDGLADVADGLGGSYQRERALEIMKDSRVGAFGAIAVSLALVSKVSLLALLGSLHSGLMVLGVFAGHVVSRTWPLLTIRLLPHVGDSAQSKSKPLAAQISAAALASASLWCFLAVASVFVASVATNSIANAALTGVAAACLWAAAIGVSGLAWWVMHRWFAQRLQGFTGDCLGAAQQACEMAFYLGLALAWPAASTWSGA